MYKLENGCLFKNDKKIYPLGQSYYPSFHKAKYPVPPEGDRIGEMKKDLKMMREMGFNHVRFAALGTMELDENDNIISDTSFVDEMIKEAEKNDMSVSVRLQGYVINLHGYKNVLMINNEGKQQDTSLWYNFIQNTLHHEGLAEDNRLATETLAIHFEKFDNVVAYQIYNEPHYPTDGVFDYHPLAIQAYRKWLVNNSYMTEDEAKCYEPPKSRKEKTAVEWVRWRMFARDSLTNFLNSSSDASKAVSCLPTFTCFTTIGTHSLNAASGVDYYANPKSMDILGYTCYLQPEGADYFTFGATVDAINCAAEIQGKKAWCIELDSRTKIPPDIFNKETYATVGAGVSGIIYYQWRGDYPSEATPIPNGCGLINYDGSKTANFENAGKMVKLINTLSDYIVNAKKHHSSIGILYSDYANFMCDATENDDNAPETYITNTFLTQLSSIYEQIRRKGYNVDVADAQSLKENILNIKTLFVPAHEKISEGEKRCIQEFIKNGGDVYVPELVRPFGCSAGYRKYGTKKDLYDSALTINDICEVFAEKPPIISDNPYVMAQLLDGDGYKLAALTNISVFHKSVPTKLFVNFSAKKATVYCSTEQAFSAEVKDGTADIRNIKDGAFVIFE